MLDAPVQDRTAKASASPRRTAGAPRLRRDLSDDFAKRPVSQAQGEDAEEYVPRRRFGGLRFRLRGGVPRSTAGRLLAGGVVLGGCILFTTILWVARSMVLHDPRLILASSSSIQATQSAGDGGNSHLTRAQLLSIFGGDVDRNILTVPLTLRRAELESLPWVEHATVMRLLPNRLRVSVVERTPVAFVRQGGHIGLVDANGVLLEMSPDVPADQHYSFPVVTGITADDPLSTREARMKLYARFTADLDSGPVTNGGKLSSGLSEVDLSSPEDVMALIPVNGSDILVHLGDDDFLARYLRFQKNIADWKAGHPNLASVDMRYDREAVLEMKPGKSVEAATPATSAAADVPSAATAKASTPKAAKPGAKAAAKPEKKPAPNPRPVTHAAPSPTGGHLQTAFDVHATKPAEAGTKPRATTQAGPQ